MSLGVFPAVSLAKARELAADYRSKLGRGENLTEARRRETDTTQPLTFGQAAAEYNARRARGEDPKGPVDEKTLAHDARGFRYSKRLHGMTFAEIKRKDLVDVCNVYANIGKRETAKRMGGWFQRVCATHTTKLSRARDTRCHTARRPAGKVPTSRARKTPAGNHEHQGGRCAYASYLRRPLGRQLPHPRCVSRASVGNTHRGAGG